ncbi:MAG TPA: ACP phosphodiesterase [Salinivirgaceae bacterium]|nr:ACP phosphodiesterase [Salinivirgaceae bacterium]HQA76296.1 ACP phosphodiesterase [Salinivirgaceae bacterium]
MNYLAHLYIGHEDENLMIGNFIADFVKGSKYKEYPFEISRGILMHRQIDFTTDRNKEYIEVKKLFAESYGRYSGIIADMAYDYVLAKHWEDFCELSLYDFQKKTNSILLQNFSIIPLKGKVMLPFFVRNKWLTLYKDLSTLKNVFVGLSKYRGVKGDPEKAIEILESSENKVFSSFLNTLFAVVTKLKANYHEVNNIKNNLIKMIR